MVEGYLLHLDILGFSEIVKNLDSDALSKKIDIYKGIVSTNVSKYQIKHYKYLSDTLIAYVDVGLDELTRLIDFSRDLLEECLKQSIPLRGAILYDEFAWDDMCYGKAICDAVELEKMQDWIGVLVKPHSDHEKRVKEKLVCYPIHTKKDKDDPIKLYYALKWKVPSYEELTKLLIKDGLGGVPNIGKDLGWDFARKVTNTILFGIWVDKCKQDNVPMDKFYGLPICFIDMNLRSELYKEKPS